MIDGVEAQIYYASADAGTHLVNPYNGTRFVDGKVYGLYSTYKNLSGTELYKTFTYPPSIDKSICRYSCSCDTGTFKYRYWNGGGYENRSIANFNGANLTSVWDFAKHYVSSCIWTQKGWVMTDGEFIYPYSDH
jgi:hypothetical protein